MNSRASPKLTFPTARITNPSSPQRTMTWPSPHTTIFCTTPDTTPAVTSGNDLGLGADDDIFAVTPKESDAHDWLTTEQPTLPDGVEPIEHAGLDVLTGDAAPAYADEEAARLLNLPLGAPVPPAFGVAGRG